MNEEYCWKRNFDSDQKEETFLPFAPGEPNGDLAQKCAVARLNGNQTIYYDQDCEQDRACALCLIPKVKHYTLRGLNGKMALNIDTKYYLSNEQLEDQG